MKLQACTILLLGLAVVCYAQDNLVKKANELGATTLVELVRKAGLEGALTGPGPFTVFAPTNAAFAALPESVLKELMNNKELLKKVLLFHVTNGRAYSSGLSNDLLVDSLEGLKIRVNIYTKMGMNVVTVDGAKVTLVDQNATNGVIHVIDNVMFPLPADNMPTEVSKRSELSTLLTAVTVAQLGGALAGSGPFTLFAPTDAAFAKIPAATLNNLLKNVTELVAVLKYHVVPATAYSAGLSSGKVPTLNGMSVNVEVSADGVMVNDAKVVVADIPVTNGVIHEIDTVLLPNMI